MAILKRAHHLSGAMPPDVVERSRRMDSGDPDWYAGRLYPDDVGTIEEEFTRASNEDVSHQASPSPDTGEQHEPNEILVRQALGGSWLRSVLRRLRPAR